MSLQKDMLDIGEAARDASRKLAVLTARRKNSILTAMATELEARKPDILEANKIDLAAAEANDISGAMLDRLELTDARFACMIKGVLDVVALKDPVGKEISEWIRPNGLAISKVRVPIGVIGIIYESRPNVTVDASVLCFKSSNAVILRGGSECIHTNKMLALILQEGGEKKGLPPGSIQLIQTTRREAVKELVRMDQYVDLIMPRGGESLITAVTEMATVPVIKHYNGICHTYIDKDANLEMALDIAENAKCQRPGVCNAMETLLVHEDVAKQFLPRMATRLVARGVEMRGDERSRALVPEMKEAVEEDWDTEHLDLILGIRVVSDLHAATDHINTHGSKHSDAIISDNESAQKKFTQEVDSATVYVNASTRFTDGAEFGLGAEIGISTDKLHARGPMGLEELTTYKYVIMGSGQIR